MSTIGVKGVALSNLQGTVFAGSTFQSASATEANILALKNNFGINTIRLQMQQQMLAGPDGNQYSTNYQNECDQVIQYALGLGLTVVINSTTEGWENPRKIVLPNQYNTGTNVFWDKFAPAYNGNPNVIFDIFNEPYGTWAEWQSSMQSLIDYMRGNLGLTNVLWAEPNSGAASLNGCPGLTDPLNNLVYSYHHPPAPYTSAQWDTDFGNWASSHIVVSGEFAQNNNYNWNNQTAVSQYLDYLLAHGIGLIVWTAFGDGTFCDNNGKPSGWWGSMVDNLWNSAEPVLTEGDTGPAVVTLQTRLNIWADNVTVDGDFGPLTFSAVENFQTQHKLNITGVVDQITWAALNNNPYSHVIPAYNTLSFAAYAASRNMPESVLASLSQGTSLMNAEDLAIFNTYLALDSALTSAGQPHPAMPQGMVIFTYNP